MIRDAIALDAWLFAEPTVDTATMHGNLGWALAEAGDGEAALAALDQAEVLMARAGGGNQAYARSRRIYRANACLQCGRVEQALAIVDELLAEASPLPAGMRANCRRIRAAAMRRLGRSAQALGDLEAMIDSARAPGVIPRHLARAYIEAAELHAALGRRAEAATQAQRAIELLEPIQTSDSPLIRIARRFV